MFEQLIVYRIRAGMDVALVRVQLVDANGVVVTGDDKNVTFSVPAAGPVRITGEPITTLE